jgi:ribosome-associated protein
MIPVTESISLSEDELEERFVRSPGPGGQHVNKVETAVQLRFDAANSPNLPPEVLTRLRRLAGRRMTRDGVVVIAASPRRGRRHRRQPVPQPGAQPPGRPRPPHRTDSRRRGPAEGATADSDARRLEASAAGGQEAARPGQEDARPGRRARVSGRRIRFTSSGGGGSVD